MDGGPHGPGFDAPLACPCAAALDAACRLPGRAGVAVVLLGRRGRGAGAGPFRGGVTHCAGLGDQCVHAHLRQPVARRRRPGRPLWPAAAVPAGYGRLQRRHRRRLPGTHAVVAGPGARAAGRCRCSSAGVRHRRIGAGLAGTGARPRLCPAGHDIRCRVGTGAAACRPSAAGTGVAQRVRGGWRAGVGGLRAGRARPDAGGADPGPAVAGRIRAACPARALGAAGDAAVGRGVRLHRTGASLTAAGPLTVLAAGVPRCPAAAGGHLLRLRGAAGGTAAAVVGRAWAKRGRGRIADAGPVRTDAGTADAGRALGRAHRKCAVVHARLAGLCHRPVPAVAPRVAPVALAMGAVADADRCRNRVAVGPDGWAVGQRGAGAACRDGCRHLRNRAGGRRRHCVGRSDRLARAADRPAAAGRVTRVAGQGRGLSGHRCACTGAGAASGDARRTPAAGQCRSAGDTAEGAGAADRRLCRAAALTAAAASGGRDQNR
ncbi:hypothetical protein G6F57_009300 [Rhizopus arrhizus]|nr:hypothetical protein G6F22_011215 [Rhizopus arrhizus]KAG1475946.1 hypothetical protein G6F57_009300 [Rhizopus arrhizus]